MSDTAPATFEVKLDRIDAILKELETANVPLDRAIALFKEGKTLVRECEVALRANQELIDAAIGDAAGGG